MLIPFPISACLRALYWGKRKDHNADEWKMNAVHCGTDGSGKSNPLFTQISSLICGILKKKKYFLLPCHSPQNSGDDRHYYTTVESLDMFLVPPYGGWSSVDIRIW